MASIEAVRLWAIMIEIERASLPTAPLWLLLNRMETYGNSVTTVDISE